MMGVLTGILMHAFGRPRGLLGRLGGLMMARTNKPCAAWVVMLLDIQPQDQVLEIGFGSGVAVELMTQLTATGFVAGIDASKEMVRQATVRNAKTIESGRVELQHGSVEHLPFADNSFDKALVINSMQVWPDAMAGLREIRRVLKAGGKIALGFTPYSGQSKNGMFDVLKAAGFVSTCVVESERGFCVLGIKL